MKFYIKFPLFCLLLTWSPSFALSEEEEDGAVGAARQKRGLINAALPGMADILFDFEEEKVIHKRMNDFHTPSGDDYNDLLTRTTRRTIDTAEYPKRKRNGRKGFRKRGNLRRKNIRANSQNIDVKLRFSNGQTCGNGKGSCESYADCNDGLCFCKTVASYGLECENRDGAFFAGLIIPSTFPPEQENKFRDLELKGHRILKLVEDLMTLRQGEECQEDLEGKLDPLLEYFGNLGTIDQLQFQGTLDDMEEFVTRGTSLCDYRQFLNCKKQSILEEPKCEYRSPGRLHQSPAGHNSQKLKFLAQEDSVCQNHWKIFDRYYEFKCGVNAKRNGKSKGRRIRQRQDQNGPFRMRKHRKFPKQSKTLIGNQIDSSQYTRI